MQQFQFNKNHTIFFKRIYNSSLIRSSGVYTLTSILNALIPFLLLRILTSNLTKTEYGHIAMFMTIVTFVLPMVGLSMEGALAREYYQKNKSISEYLSSCILISIFLTFIVTFIYISIQFFFNIELGVPEKWVILSIVYSCFQFIIQICLTLFQLKIKPLYYGAIQIFISILNFVISYIFVVIYDWKWEGRLYPQFFIHFIVAAILLRYLVKRYSLRPDYNKQYLIEIFRFGFGLLPHAIGGAVILVANRFFLLKMVSISEAGSFAVATQLAGVIGFITLSFNNAFVPWLFERLKQSEMGFNFSIVRNTYFYFMILALVGLVYYLFLPFGISFFVDQKFNDSLAYTSWLILGFIFQGMYYMVTNYIIYTGKTIVQSAITVFIGIISLPLNYFLISKFGAIGASVSFSVSYFLMFLFTWIAAERLYPMPWNLKVITSNHDQ